MTTWASIGANNNLVLADLTTVDPVDRFAPSIKWVTVPDALAQDPIACQVGLVVAADGVTVQVRDPAAYAAVVKANLAAYAIGKQQALLAAVFSHPLADGSATLTTACDPVSLTGLNSLTQLATTPALNASVGTRVYYNVDWSPHTVTPAQMAEFAAAIGAHVQALYTDLATVVAAINGGTITTTAQIDAANWS